MVNNRKNSSNPNYSKKSKNNQDNNNKKQTTNYNYYSGAPYNFVSFPDKVYEYDKLVAHNSMEEDLQTGEITYEITAKSPIMVDDGTEHFYKNPKGEYAIPGSTMRGLIRNNVQILGLGNFYDDIDDYALMYRSVAKPKYNPDKKKYETTLGQNQLSVEGEKKKYSIGILTNVQAGYVEKQGNNYVIYKTVIDTISEKLGEKFQKINYYVLSERKVVSEYLKNRKNFDYKFFLKNGKSIMQHQFHMFEKRGNKWIGETNDFYKPYYEEISYEISGDRDVSAVGKVGDYKRKGYVISTGKMNEKKAIYIIPEIDRTKESIQIPDKDVKAFQIDLNKRKNTLKTFGGKEFFDLPQEEGKIKPIFYIELGGKLYFGFTPRLRLFYEHTIKEGLNKNHKANTVDYSKSLFGYANSDSSYKSKLSFSDAVVSGQALLEEERNVMLAEPKPTSYRDYLKPSDNPKDENKAITYNNQNFKLRGVKQYWLHEQLVKEGANARVVDERDTNSEKKPKIDSTIRALSTETKFIGTVRFQNLTKDELGLLLWSIQLNKNSHMNVGKGKPYGYGMISLQITEAKVVDKKKAYKLDSLNLQPFESIDVENMICCYKEKMKTYLNGKEIDSLPHIKEFFMIKDNVLKNGKIKYMSIQRKIKGMDKVNEYQKRENAGKVLLSIEETIKNKS